MVRRIQPLSTKHQQPLGSVSMVNTAETLFQACIYCFLSLDSPLKCKSLFFPVCRQRAYVCGFSFDVAEALLKLAWTDEKQNFRIHYTISVVRICAIQMQMHMGNRHVRGAACRPLCWELKLVFGGQSGKFCNVFALRVDKHSSFTNEKQTDLWNANKKNWTIFALLFSKLKFNFAFRAVLSSLLIHTMIFLINGFVRGAASW